MTRGIFTILTTFASFFTFAKAAPQVASPSDCVGTISSVDDVKTAIQCKTVDINALTVPSGHTLNLDLGDGTTVNLLSGIDFIKTSASGPLFKVSGNDIIFNGGGNTLNGNGQEYWDGAGLSSGTYKPDPMISFQISGMLSNFVVKNSPARAISLGSNGAVVVSNVKIDNNDGAYPNDKSGGQPAGRNTDGFDVDGNDITIKDSGVINQDDCVAIVNGKNIQIQNLTCQEGHGISIGSISSDIVVEDVTIEGNTVVDSVQAFRIKTKKSASNSRVDGVIYSKNTASNCSQYGLVVTQSYPENFGSPGDGVIISNISFTETTTISVADAAEQVALNCGQYSCIGPWDFSGLTVSGGKSGQLVNAPTLEGYDL